MKNLNPKLPLILGALVLAASLSWPSSARMPPSRTAATTLPNIVVVMADDLDWLLGTLDYTPYIRDLLQYQGVTFENAFVPVSLCCPSRASFLRGQYVHNHEILTNGPPEGGFQKALDLNLEDSTVATVLQSAGYRTALIGKYLNGYPLTSALTYIPPGWNEFYSPSSDAAYFGFNYTMNMSGTLVPFGAADEDYMTDVLSRTAVNFITRTASASPFFMYVGTYAPHGPSVPAPRHSGLFTNVLAPMGGSFNEADMSDKPPLISMLPMLTITDIVDIHLRYRERIRSMQAVDEMVASMVGALHSQGVLTNTYFVFTSDNGYHMGQHRFPPGKLTNYEEDLRVPLIVRGPGVPVSQTVSALASTMDLAPTFAEIAGTTMPAYVDGRSLLGLLNGSATKWREVFFLEQFPFESQIDDTLATRNGLLEPNEQDQTWRRLQAPTSMCTGVITNTQPIYTGLRGTRYKYVEHHACDKELYDLDNDPYELNNIYSLVSPTLQADLAIWLTMMEVCAAERCRFYENAQPRVAFLPSVSRGHTLGW